MKQALRKKKKICRKGKSNKKKKKKNYGGLITCAFNVFHTNFLIKHNCVLTEPSIFLFFLPDHCSSPSCPLTAVRCPTTNELLILLTPTIHPSISHLVHFVNFERTMFIKPPHRGTCAGYNVRDVYFVFPILKIRNENCELAISVSTIMCIREKNEYTQTGKFVLFTLIFVARVFFVNVSFFFFSSE